ncbi:hypoxanthine-guanine phosphoribosyltransferase [Staphylococcus gallinarum]|uniref:Hypoxanthine-guanine phosphoribosyltransferase n=1 Tax=Staphylococcus gallinarum TaxID=1293 RepID=A0A380FBA7_STAGA|nr:hypoxanthine-guanine phosphoribosyltransferase [Staphylococcus gallinarum]
MRDDLKEILLSEEDINQICKDLGRTNYKGLSRKAISLYRNIERVSHVYGRLDQTN